MKFAIFAVVLFLAIAVCSAGSYGGAAPASGGYGGGAAAPAPMTMPAPPCPKNYLFSCQPNLSPAPCSPSAGGGYGSANGGYGSASGGYGSAGAYSQNYPVYSVPQYFNGFRAY